MKLVKLPIRFYTYLSVSVNVDGVREEEADVREGFDFGLFQVITVTYFIKSDWQMKLPIWFYT